MAHVKDHKSSSMSFSFDAGESIVDFLNRQMKEHQDLEKAVKARIEQLFDKYSDMGENEKSKAYYQILSVFTLGYGLWWNDCKDMNEIYN